MYWNPKQKKINWKTIGDPAEWIDHNCTHYCPLWETKMRDGVCTERKELANSTMNRFSVGDGISSRTFDRCLECDGAIPMTEIGHYLEKKEMKEQKPISTTPQLGEEVHCQVCGEEFSAYKNGRMIVWKKCPTCATQHRSNMAYEREQVKRDAKRTVVPPDDLHCKPPIQADQDGPEFWIDQDGLEDSFIPVPIADPGHVLWDSLFEKEKDLFKKLKFLAQSERRDFHNQILYMLETHHSMIG